MSHTLIRRVPFFAALGFAAIDLVLWASGAGSEKLAAAAVFSSFALGGGLLFGMLVLVRGAHGFMGPAVRVATDASFRLPVWSMLLLSGGGVFAAYGFIHQQGTPGSLLPFGAGLAIMGAAATQLRRFDEAG